MYRSCRWWINRDWNRSETLICAQKIIPGAYATGGGATVGLALAPGEPPPGLSPTLGRRSSWQRCPISLLMLYQKRACHSKGPQLQHHGRKKDAPALTRSTLVAGHMAPSTVETGMVDLASFGRLLLLAGVVFSTYMGVELRLRAVGALHCGTTCAASPCRHWSGFRRKIGRERGHDWRVERR